MQRISELSEALSTHFLQMVQTDGKIYTFDFFVAGATDRAISISRAFRSMLNEKNYVASAILLRSQIDTFFRVFGITLVDDPLAFCEEIFRGARYDTLGSVEIHFELMTAEQRWIIAAKLRSVLSDLMAMRLNSLSLQKKFSIKCLHL